MAAAASSPRYGCRGASGVSAAGYWLLICVDWLLAAGLSLLVAVWLLLAACFRFGSCFVLQLDASCLLAAASAATQVRPQICLHNHVSALRLNFLADECHWIFDLYVRVNTCQFKN